MAGKYTFKPLLRRKSIPEWSERYPVEYDQELETVIAPQVKARGYFLQEEFVRLCRWKTPRSQRKVASNSVDYIEAITRTALSTQNERLRIEILLLLDGVRWPTASVVLHFCHADPYPILDFRALWSLGVERPVSYNFEYWWEYTKYCRRLAEETGLSMRELDRALWQYSKEKAG